MKIKSSVVFLLTMTSGWMWAASVTTDGEGRTVIDVPEGETYTYAQAIAGTGIRKTGAGTAKFGTASSATTPIAIEEGVADFTVLNAYGKGAITVSDGAQMLVSHDSLDQQVVQVSGTVTIAGSGPDGLGAIRYTGGGKKLADNLLQKIVLAGDATLSGGRWGAKEVDFGGHVFTWKGTTWMALGASWKNFGGFVHKGSSDLCLQSITLDASCTAEKTITLDTTVGGHISFWNCATPIPFKLIVKESSKVVGNWGFAMNRNVWTGPIEILEGKQLTLATRDPSDGAQFSLRIAGKITGAGSVRSSGGYGVVYLDNESNDWTGGTTVASRRFAPLSPATLPGVTEGKVVVSDTGTAENYLYLNVGPAKSGVNVQHTWTVDEIQVLQDNIAKPTGHFGGIAFDVASDSTYTFPNEVKQHIGLVRTAGTVQFTGAFVSNVSVNVRGTGRVVLDAPGAHTHKTFCLNEGGVLDIRQGDHVLAGGMIRIGNGSRGAVWQSAGTSVAQTSSDSIYMAEAANSYGVWLQQGGCFTNRNNIILGKGKESFGFCCIKGGSVVQTTTGCNQIGYDGNGTMYVGNGGTNEVFTAGVGGTTTQIGLGGGGCTSVLTVDGTGSVYRTRSLVLGNNDAVHTNIVNLCDGGTLEADRLFKNCYYKLDTEATAETLPPGAWTPGSGKWYIPFSNGCYSVINANGGVIMPTFGYGWNHVGGVCPPRDIDKIVLFEKGLVVDTAQCMNDKKTIYAANSFPHHLDAATGRGFDAIYLPTNNATFKSQVYIGPARIRISDTTGWAATAFADFDPRTGKLTGVKVTSRGCDYSDNPTVTVDSADGKTTFDCTYELSENVCGGLTKRGSPTMEIYNTCTYTGTTCVEAGTLRFVYAKSLPADSHCRVKKDATLQLPGASTLKSAGGSGMITGGAVTLKDGIRAHAEDLNAGRHLSVNNALTFAEGAKVTVDDPAEVGSDRAKWPLVVATSAIVGTPTLDTETLPAPYGLKFSDDRKTLYLVCPRGTTFIFR